MTQPDPGSDAATTPPKPSTLSGVRRAALLLGAAGAVSTTALVMTFGPKIPPFQGD